MYVGVISIVLGEALLVASPALMPTHRGRAKKMLKNTENRLLTRAAQNRAHVGPFSASC
jgi:hypothetical protein